MPNDVELQAAVHLIIWWQVVCFKKVINTYIACFLSLLQPFWPYVSKKKTYSHRISKLGQKQCKINRNSMQINVILSLVLYSCKNEIKICKEILLHFSIHNWFCAKMVTGCFLIPFLHDVNDFQVMAFFSNHIFMPGLDFPICTNYQNTIHNKMNAK